MDGIDESYIWDRRIARGIRYQKGKVPFPESVDIGVEFNAAVERKEKLDQSLLTNSVMLEICQFAKTVTRSEKYFLFEMLEFNFDLGFDINNDSLCYVYAVRVHNRIKHLKEQIKMKPNRWKETFQLPDPSVLARSKEEEASGRYCPKWHKVADSSVLGIFSKNCQSSDNNEAETTRVASNKHTVKKQGGIHLRKTQGANPFCTQLGVTLAVRPSQAPKQKLDPHLLTNGVMIEMLDFSRVLCGTHTYIVYELVKHNFGYAFNKPQFRMCLNRVIERKNTCQTAEDKESFRKELFKVPAEKNQWEYKGKKRKTPDADNEELEAQILASNKRQTRRQQANKTEELEDDDLSYMCPVEFETELQSATEAEPENVKPESCFSGTEVEMNVLQDAKPEEDDVFISPMQTLNNGHKSWSPTQTKVASQDWCLFSEGRCAETPKQRLWLRRAARTKQILMSSRVNDMFAHCRKIGLDFNFCSGTKRSLDLQLLTNWVMWEVFKFGTALSRSVRSFLFEILLNNFTLTLQDEQHERNFLVYMMAKYKNLANHPKSQNMDFLCKPFKLPEIYHMVDVTSSFQTQQELRSRGEEGLDSSDSAKSEEAGKEKHPFCKKLGLNLWSTKERPSDQKLDLTILTTGAVLEIFSFVKELCGDSRNTVNDILEHNFDLDLQSGETEAAQKIQRWYTTQKSLMKKQNMSPKINRWLNMIVLLNGNSQEVPHSPTGDGEYDLEEELDGFGGFVKRFDYQKCKDIGLNLDLSSKSESKTKLDLQVLTRGVLFEVHQYVQQNYNRYVPALYEILEYNFDLSSQSHRKVEFAWSIASQVIAMTGKKRRKGDYLNKVFELPFEASESSQMVFKEEPEDAFGEPDLNNDNDDIVFVQKLKPVDMEVEID